MKPYLVDAYQEFKRVDHLLFVSLKYTRTADMLTSVLDRLIACFDAFITGMLSFASEKQPKLEIPHNAAMKASLFSKSFPQEKLADVPQFFLFLRNLKRREYNVSNEFRRHVTMSVIFPEIIMNISIDKLHYYYEATKEFLEEAQKLIEPTND